MTDAGSCDATGASRSDEDPLLTRAERRRRERPPHAPRITKIVGLIFALALTLMVGSIVLRFLVGESWAAIVAWVGLVLFLVAMASDELLWLHQQSRVSGSWSAALRSWLHKPREPISGVHWRLYLTAGVLTFGLVYGGGSVLIGPGQTMRWAGALALVTGLLVGAGVFLIIARPSSSRE
jgi:hypothetical protein